MQNRVKKYRQSFNLSQQQLADICQLSKAFICNIERGERNPTVEVAQKLTVALYAKIEDLFPSDFVLAKTPEGQRVVRSRRIN